MIFSTGIVSHHLDSRIERPSPWAMSKRAAAIPKPCEMTPRPSDRRARFHKPHVKPQRLLDSDIGKGSEPQRENRHGKSHDDAMSPGEKPAEKEHRPMPEIPGTGQAADNGEGWATPRMLEHEELRNPSLPRSPPRPGNGDNCDRKGTCRNWPRRRTPGRRKRSRQSRRDLASGPGWPGRQTHR